MYFACIGVMGEFLPLRIRYTNILHTIPAASQGQGKGERNISHLTKPVFSLKSDFVLLCGNLCCYTYFVDIFNFN